MIFALCSGLLLASSPIVSYESVIREESNYQNCATKERPTLLLYYTSYCPYSQKVLKYLKKIHKQVPLKDLEGNSKAKSELKKIGGKMQVPCLVINGKALYESDAIIEWLSQHQDALESA